MEQFAFKGQRPGSGICGHRSLIHALALLGIPKSGISSYGKIKNGIADSLYALPSFITLVLTK